MRKLIIAGALIAVLAGCAGPAQVPTPATGDSRPFLQAWINSMQGPPPPESTPVPNGAPVDPLTAPLRGQR